MSGNFWCQELEIAPPRLEAIARSPEVNTFALLVAVLLERGAPMKLDEVAIRMEIAGIADHATALHALKRCRPDRRPLYREGDLYHLDPFDEESTLWLMRLGLRARTVTGDSRREPDETPSPDPDVPLSPAELDRAWNTAMLYSWSSQRLAVAVLDAYGGPLAPEDVVALVTQRTWEHPLDTDSEKFRRKGKGVQVLADGRWTLAPDAAAIIAKTRAAIRERAATGRRRSTRTHGIEEIDRAQDAAQRKHAARRAALARMSRALVVAFPPRQPRAVVLLDIVERQIDFYVDDELTTLRTRLAKYDMVVAVGVRELLRALGIPAHLRRVAELGPPQKTIAVDKKPITITTEMLVAGTCRISQPFGDEATLAAQLARGDVDAVRRQLETDAKSLYALYEYGRLHRNVYLRWGPINEPVMVPWVHRDEASLHTLLSIAHLKDLPLEVVVGAAPTWKDPWSRARRAHVVAVGVSWNLQLVDDAGEPIEKDDVQRARLADKV